MPDNMIEIKKDALSQRQSGDWKASFTLQAMDMPDYLLTSPMGKRFYVVFVDADDYDEREGIKKEYFPDGTDTARSHGINDPITRFTVAKRGETEGEKLRTRAVMLCMDVDFQLFTSTGSTLSLNAFEWEEYARTFICNYCHIKSRSEIATNLIALQRFKELLEKYKDWQYENQYSENLSR